MRKLLLIALPLILLASCARDEQPAANPTVEPGEVITLDNGIKLEVRDGLYIYQGDMILTPQQVEILGAVETRGHVVYPYVKTWPNGTIYYTVNAQMSSASMLLLNQAMEHWQANTDITFALRTNQPDYVEFNTTQGIFTSAHVGRVTGKQNVTFSTNSNIGDLLHLIGHAAGLIDEHARPDRDDYLNFYPDEMIPGFFGLYFQIDPSGVMYKEFDFNSVMLCTSYDYSMYGNPTVTKKDGQPYVANRTALSAGDKAAVKFLYNEYKEDLLLHLSAASPFPTGTTVGFSASYYSLTCTSPAYKYEVINASTNAVVYTSAITTGGVNYTFPTAGTFRVRVTVTNETPQKSTETTVVVQPPLQIQISGGDDVYATDSRTISAVYSPANPNATFTYVITGPHANVTFTGKTVFHTFCQPGTYTIKATPTNVIPATPVQKTVVVQPYQGHLYEIVTEQLIYDWGTEKRYKNTLRMSTSGNPMEGLLLHCMPKTHIVSMPHFRMKRWKNSGHVFENVSIGPVSITMTAGGSPIAQLPDTYVIDRGDYIESTYLIYLKWNPDPELPIVW